MNADDMMINVEWDDPKGVSSPELAATWARVGIRIGGLVPTRILDQRAQTVRDELYVPTYPLAEWIACNWHVLLHESRNLSRDSDGRGARARHCLRSGREGFAVPALEMWSDGDAVQFRCARYAGHHEPVEFLEDGREELPLGVVRNALAGFVRLTVARLSAQGIEGTRLQDEWACVEGLDAEEEAFCVAAARLGYDPFSLDDQAAVAVTGAGSLLPGELQEDFFDAALLPELARQTQQLLGLTREVRAKHGRGCTRLGELRGRMGGERMSLPWQQGYSQAQAFREALGIGNRTLASWRALLEALGLDSRCRCPSFPPMGSFEGLAGPSQAGSPVIIVSGQASAASQRFAFCRALSGFLDSGWSLATTSHSARQKRNRAFAAELLAPADMIREEIREGIVGSETVERVAAKFGVSEYVVGHQIENHGIAELYVGAR